MLSVFLICWRFIVRQSNNIGKDGVSLFHHTRRREKLGAIVYSLKQRKPYVPFATQKLNVRIAPENSELNFSGYRSGLSMSFDFEKIPM